MSAIRLKKSRSILKLKSFNKMKAGGDFLSSQKLLHDSEKEVEVKHQEIKSLLAYQALGLTAKASLDPTLIQMNAHYLSSQYQLLDTLVEVAHTKNRDLCLKREVLIRSSTEEKVFEKLVDKLKTEHVQLMLKAEMVHNELKPMVGNTKQ